MNKVWTFVIEKNVSANELATLRDAGTEFVKSWTAHDNPLDASFEIVKDRLIRVTVNERAYAASGCSIDKLTRFIKQAGENLGTDLLDRHLVAYETGEGRLQVVRSDQIPALLEKGTLKPDTAVYDNTISDESQLWKKPLRDTWLSRFLRN